LTPNDLARDLLIGRSLFR